MGKLEEKMNEKFFEFKDFGEFGEFFSTFKLFQKNGFFL